MRKSVDWILLFCLLGLVECNTTEPIQEPEIKKLSKDLKSKNAEVRADAAFALGRRKGGAKNAVPVLIQALEDQDGNVRINAVLALGLIGAGAKDAMPALIRTLQDPNSDSP